MGTITAKQLKQKTGEVIKRIKSGERLILTYRGKPLAVIEPAFDKTKKAVDQVKEFQKAWESIESTLNQTTPEFKDWREATRWVRKRR
jgi:prevent-host-death family protein